MIALLVIGVGLLIARAWNLPSSPEIAQFSLPPAEVVIEPEIAYVGRITGMVDCRLEEGSGFRVQGSWAANQKSLVALGDKFALASGLMEITYNTGAKVVLQGPCTYEAESAAGGFLSLGKLTAKVNSVKPQAANPQSLIPNPSSLSTIHYPLFTIKTPTAT
ncbi:MAG: hypothetical protein IMZ62_05960, partial [Chloroflexi bacterium]|nr:hypothetical protein [Chloroflexota bacterium]